MRTVRESPLRPESTIIANGVTMSCTMGPRLSRSRMSESVSSGKAVFAGPGAAVSGDHDDACTAPVHMKRTSM